MLDVVAGGAGEAAGLKRYDVITARRRTEPVADGDQLVRTISAPAPGSTVVAQGVPRRAADAALPAGWPSARSRRRPATPPEHGGRRRPCVGDALGLVVAELRTGCAAELAVPPDRRAWWCKRGRGPRARRRRRSTHGRRDRGGQPPAHPDVAAYEQGASARLAPGEAAWLLVYRPRPPAVFLAKVEVEPGPLKPRRS